ncbi:MAG: rod shape-determining protein MreC [Rubrivivax sp.]
MPLGTLDRTPPPFFRQGTPALTKLVFFAALAVFLMVADARFKLVEPLRAGLAILLTPMQRAMMVPVDIARGGAGYLQGLTAAQEGERRARDALIAQAARSAQVEQLEGENRRLRALLDLRPALTVRSQAAEILYEAADPYSRKVFINRGQASGVALGAPVVNDQGVLGQVTHVYPITAEVTLLADKDAAIPVLNARTQQRSAAFGVGGSPGGMELRFASANADVQPGDLLQTSGIDGVYPPGLPVAKVVSVERRVESGFARIALAPAAAPDAVRHVLVLEPLALQMPARPEAAPEKAPEKPEKAPRKGSARP